MHNRPRRALHTMHCDYSIPILMAQKAGCGKWEKEGAKFLFLRHLAAAVPKIQQKMAMKRYLLENHETCHIVLCHVIYIQ